MARIAAEAAGVDKTGGFSVFGTARLVILARWRRRFGARLLLAPGKIAPQSLCQALFAFRSRLAGHAWLPSVW